MPSVEDEFGLVFRNNSPVDLGVLISGIQQVVETYEQQGYEVVQVEGAWFEGGNIILHQVEGQNTVFFGMLDEQDPESARLLIEAVNSTQPDNWEVLGVPLEDTPHFYHLDLAMSYQLPRGEVLLYPGVTDPETYERIKEIVGPENIIEVDREVAATFALNVNYVGNTILLSAEALSLETELVSRGYNVIDPADYGLDSFVFDDGGVHCITNEFSVPGNSAPKL